METCEIISMPFTVIQPHDGNTGCGEFIVIGIAGTGEE